MLATSTAPLARRFVTHDGHVATLQYVTSDGWFGLRCDGESSTHEYPAHLIKQVTRIGGGK